MRGFDLVFWTLFTIVPTKAIVIWLATLPVLVMRIHLVHREFFKRPNVFTEYQTDE